MGRCGAYRGGMTDLPFTPANPPAPELGNQYDDDRVLRAYLARTLPPEMLREIEPSLREMGELAGGELYRLQLEDRLLEPVHTPWDPWGNRIDRIDVSPLWKRAERITAEQGIVAIPYERRHGKLSRVHQFALVYLFTASNDIYSCPLAMTDGAARTLVKSGNRALLDRALPHLISRDPAKFWTSGQWMTEATGGSDVGTSETIARKDADGRWRLWGRKWFTSAATSQMALTLARPEGNGAGGSGLALFYLETRDDAGRLRDIEVHRLKEKLGTRKVPTAELTILGAAAELVMGTTDGVRNITPMLNVTRTWNSVSAVALMRRAIALARDYARKRAAFGALLSEKPLHLDTMAGLQAELEGAFLLTFRVAELFGAEEAGELDAAGEKLFRLLTPIAKLVTGKQAVDVASEAIEAFGGAGYVEDTGLPALLRDAHVLPIWEGTTNVLSLDVLRVLAKDPKGALAPLAAEIASGRTVRDAELVACADVAVRAYEHATAWLGEAHARGPAALEAGARRFALTLGRATELSLLARAADHALSHGGDRRPAAAAKRFARSAIDLITAVDDADSRRLANDTP